MSDETSSALLSTAIAAFRRHLTAEITDADEVSRAEVFRLARDGRSLALEVRVDLRTDDSGRGLDVAATRDAARWHFAVTEIAASGGARRVLETFSLDTLTAPTL